MSTLGVRIEEENTVSVVGLLDVDVERLNSVQVEILRHSVPKKYTQHENGEISERLIEGQW